MKVHEFKIAWGARKCWYDPHERMWTLQSVDEKDDQVGNVAYLPSRAMAMAWLKGDPKLLAHLHEEAKPAIDPAAFKVKFI